MIWWAITLLAIYLWVLRLRLYWLEQRLEIHLVECPSNECRSANARKPVDEAIDHSTP